MAGLRWITVTMVFCLSAGSLAKIDQKQLAELIYHLTRTVRYEHNSMYAVAVSIPNDEGQVNYDLGPVTKNQQLEWKDGILRIPRLVAARIKVVTPEQGERPYTEHAEWRLLKNLNLEGQDDDLLVFFSYAAPCLTSCANPNGPYKITDWLRELFTEHKWGEKAFVFEAIFKPSGKKINSATIKRITTEALTNIGNYIGSENIFRCYRPVNRYICIRCFNGGGDIDPSCTS